MAQSSAGRRDMTPFPNSHKSPTGESGKQSVIAVVLGLLCWRKATVTSTSADAFSQGPGLQHSVADNRATGITSTVRHERTAAVCQVQQLDHPRRFDSDGRPTCCTPHAHHQQAPVGLGIRTTARHAYAGGEGENGLPRPLGPNNVAHRLLPT